MPKITQITTQKRPGRYNIFLDGHYAFPVSESTLIKFRLAKGMAIDAELEQQLKAAEVTANANSLALDYLSHQPRTIKEVHQKLAENELPEPAIQATIARLIDLHYLDDAQYARGYLHDNLHLGDKGPKVMTTKLRQKGIDANTIQDALATIADADWQAAALRVGQKAAKHYARLPFHTTLQKTRLTMIQKGFTSEMANAVMAELDLQPDTDGEAERLQKEAAKQWRLKHRYSGYDRRQRVKQALYRKGFQLDAIDKALAALEQAAD
ncbi:recombination regulator RecX [Lacticaseibacillus baoqingensis]|nr:recombination regulator RecX [Lacticaseibacillus baoqingensis]